MQFLWEQDIAQSADDLENSCILVHGSIRLEI